MYPEVNYNGCAALSPANNNILKQLVLQEKQEKLDYEAESIHRIQIYFADSQLMAPDRHVPQATRGFHRFRARRSGDTSRRHRDFLKLEKWYADRGIPFRRGYLLRGIPSSRKSSLIHAIAGELRLDIYVVSLSSSWTNDSRLTALMSHVPARRILLPQDFDAAFSRSISRDSASTGAPSLTLRPSRRTTRILLPSGVIQVSRSIIERSGCWYEG